MTTPNTAKRATYGFKLEFPETFTMASLLRQKRGTISYITLHKRVEKAVKLGQLTVTGKKDPKVVRKGRKELLYTRVNAMTPSVTTSNAVGVA